MSTDTSLHSAKNSTAYAVKERLIAVCSCIDPYGIDLLTADARTFAARMFA
jgi:hypothetical protein